MISTVLLVSCLLFFYSRCPRAQPFVKVGARSPVPYGVGATASLQQRNVANLRIRRNIVYGIYTCRNTRSANNYILTTHSLSK